MIGRSHGKFEPGPTPEVVALANALIGTRGRDTGYKQGREVS